MTIKIGSKVLLRPFYLPENDEHEEINEPAQIGTVVSINKTGPAEMEVQLDEEFIDWEIEQGNGLREVPNEQITEIPE